MNLSLLIRGFIMITVLTTGILLLGGRTDYWQAWVFGLVNLLLIIAVAGLLAGMADTIRERMKPARDAKSWDKVLMALFFPLTTSVIIIAGLDGGRYQWLGPPSILVYPFAYVVYVLSAYLHLWSISTNDHYTSTVAIRPGSGHVVIDSGPYAYIRHPGYTGIILMEVCISLVLGSYIALLPAALVAALLIIRTSLEDAALRCELPGYEGYAQRVRYRLLPGIW